MKLDMRWILLGVLALILFGMQDTVPKEAVADVYGEPCAVDDDCPCWGKYNVTGQDISAYGLGTSKCVDCGLTYNSDEDVCNGTTQKVCDTRWCFDVEPVADWTRDHPWQWLKSNPMIMVGIIGITLLIVFWPKV